MRRVLLFLLFAIPCLINAQVMPNCNRIGRYLEIFGQDSIKAYYNSMGVLTDSTCALFYRVGKTDPVFCEVTGDFTDYYPCGKPMFRGTMSKGYLTGKGTYYLEDGTVFLEGEYNKSSRSGTWKAYHQNGTISLIVDYTTDGVRIIQSNTPKGKQKIVNGNGKFRGVIYTGGKYTPYEVMGKVQDGRMEGVWQMSVPYSDRIISEETYLNGNFVKGQDVDYNYKYTGHVYKDKPKISFCSAWQNEQAFFYGNKIDCPSGKFFLPEYEGSMSFLDYYSKILSTVKPRLGSTIKNQWIIVSFTITELGSMTDIWTYSSINDTTAERRISGIVSLFTKWQPMVVGGLSRKTHVFYIILVKDGNPYITEKEINMGNLHLIKTLYPENKN